MGNQDVIPRKDLEFDVFQSNLVAKVQANQVAWGIPAAVVSAIIALKTPWDTIWAVAKNKETRTSADIQAKKDARKAYETGLRKLINGALEYNPNVTDRQRVEMNLTVRDRNPTPAPIPVTVPVVTVQVLSSQRLKIRYEQEGGEAGIGKLRAKPDHVSRMEFVYKVGDTAPATADDCNGRVDISRIPFLLNLNPAYSGKRLYWFARWVNTRNQPGQWSDMGSIAIL